MKLDEFDLKDYLNRIGFQGECRSCFDDVREVMRRQLRSVAFENIDVQNGKQVSFEPLAIYNKIVHAKRGGYCYELNGVFAMFLSAMDIEYQFLACRPMFYPKLRPRTHMALAIMLEGQRYLVDVGFGSFGLREPLAFEQTDTELRQDCDSFKLTEDDGFYCLHALIEGEWCAQYGFDLSHQEWIDFLPANYLNSNHPDTLFVKSLVVLIQTESGRKVLLDRKLKTISNGVSSVRVLEPDSISGVLTDEFLLPENLLINK